MLNRLTRKAAALSLGGEILLQLVFVFSEDNPSDGASRGVRRRRELHGVRCLHAPPSTPTPRTHHRVSFGPTEVHQVEASRVAVNDVFSVDLVPPCVDGLVPTVADAGGVDAGAPPNAAGAGGARSLRPRVLRGLPDAPPHAARPAGGTSTLSKMWRPHALIVCSGFGPLGHALRNSGWLVDEIDIRLGGAQHDLLTERVRADVLHRIAAGRYHYVHCSPPCSSFSTARCPAVRSSLHPYGLPTLGHADVKKCSDGNVLGLFCLDVLKLALSSEVAASLEQPAASWMLRLPPFVDFRSQLGVAQVCLDFCAFGTPWRKRTAVLTVNVDFGRLAQRCLGCSCHQILRGRAPCGTAWTHLAEPYPLKLVDLWARCLRHLTP